MMMLGCLYSGPESGRIGNAWWGRSGHGAAGHSAIRSIHVLVYNIYNTGEVVRCTAAWAARRC